MGTASGLSVRALLWQQLPGREPLPSAGPYRPRGWPEVPSGAWPSGGRGRAGRGRAGGVAERGRGRAGAWPSGPAALQAAPPAARCPRAELLATPLSAQRSRCGAVRVDRAAAVLEEDRGCRPVGRGEAPSRVLRGAAGVRCASTGGERVGGKVGGCSVSSSGSDAVAPTGRLPTPGPSPRTGRAALSAAWTSARAA